MKWPALQVSESVPVEQLQSLQQQAEAAGVVRSWCYPTRHCLGQMVIKCLQPNRVGHQPLDYNSI